MHRELREELKRSCPLLLTRAATEKRCSWLSFPSKHRLLTSRCCPGPQVHSQNFGLLAKDLALNSASESPLTKENHNLSSSPSPEAARLLTINSIHILRQNVRNPSTTTAQSMDIIRIDVFRPVDTLLDAPQPPGGKISPQWAPFTDRLCYTGSTFALRSALRPPSSAAESARSGSTPTRLTKSPTPTLARPSASSSPMASSSASQSPCTPVPALGS